MQEMALVPEVKREFWTVIDINDDDSLELMGDDGCTRSDMTLPFEIELSDSIRDQFDTGCDTYVTVVEAMGELQIVSTHDTPPTDCQAGIS